MAGLRGNVAWLAAAKQAGKVGSGAQPLPVDEATWRNAFSGGSIGPVRETDNLSETDASRDRGVAYVTTSGVEGTPEVYVRDDSIGFWLWAAFGLDTPSGVGPDYTHVITPENTLPYVTIWKNVGDLLFERYDDCKVGSITISADAGSPLTAALGIQGRNTTRLTANPEGSWVTDYNVSDSAVYNFNEATVTLGGGATALVSSFELTVENNLTRQQTDDVQPYDVAEGTREVSLGFDLIFETLAEYNKFHFGGAAGTEVSPDIYETSATFSFDKGAANSVAFSLPHIAYEEFPVEPDPGGDPIVVSARAVGQRHAVDKIVTATVKNQVATY